jgi:BirA family biotin operon repressor/biotin-[acetyl-CoA-carboxylase] ligase
MRPLAVYNPFNAPVYYEDTVDSTMNVSRMLARRGAPHGTVIIADFQEAGRGRILGRRWIMERGNNLAFTILLRFPCVEGIPQALTLRTGLAVSLAIEDFAPVLSGKVMIKWPNDILIVCEGYIPPNLWFEASGACFKCTTDNVCVGMYPETNTLPKQPYPAALRRGWLISAKKAVGILTEADEGIVHIGIGVNVAQEEFPDSLHDKATSLRLAAGGDPSAEGRYALLEKILIRLHDEMKKGADWRSRIDARLYQKGGRVKFINGAADSGKTVTGILSGIGTGGELLITPDASPEKSPLPFTTGELILT